MFVFKKKIFFLLIIFSFLEACTTTTSMLGPIYTFSSTGNIVQTSISYGSGKLIEKKTGKTPFENLKDTITRKDTNIHKQTLESVEFYNLVTVKVNKTSNLLNKSNQ